MRTPAETPGQHGVFPKPTLLELLAMGRLLHMVGFDGVLLENVLATRENDTALGGRDGQPNLGDLDTIGTGPGFQSVAVIVEVTTAPCFPRL